MTHGVHQYLWEKDKAKIAYDYLKENTKAAFNYWIDKVKKEIVPIIKDIIDKFKKMDFTKAKKGLKKIEDAFIRVEPYLKWFAKWLIDDLVVACNNILFIFRRYNFPSF